MVDEEDNVIEPNVINWEEKIDPEEETTKATLEEMYYPPEERFNGKKQIDVRKLNLFILSGLIISRLQNQPTNMIMQTTQANMRDRLQILTVHVRM